ncbi:MAG: hypothetical protein L6U99_04655 [Clostridium sp.]|nr:MAG: hypothetical protein L6U99_04655 [Clostridium sp.]
MCNWESDSCEKNNPDSYGGANLIFLNKTRQA